MNAFLAMKGKAEGKGKDEGWLSNFLAESVVDDVPWECSKALIIMKEGYQAIIPREASRSILLGEASYTLIDDNGIEFFLSPMDKRKRRLEGKEDPEKPAPSSNGSFDAPYEFATPIVPHNGHAEKKSRFLKNTIIEEEEEDEDEFPRPDPKPKEKPLMDDADLSLFTKKAGIKKSSLDLDDEEFKPKAGRGQRFESKFAAAIDDDLDDMEKYRPATFSVDLEKYRPGNYENDRKPPESDDVKDLMDYYSSFKTQRNAMNLLPSQSRPKYSGDPEQDDFGFQQDLQREMAARKKQSDPGASFGYDQPRKKFSDPEDRYGNEFGGMDNSNMRSSNIEEPRQFKGNFDYTDSINPATRLILERARTESSTRRPVYMEQEMDAPPMRRAPQRNMDRRGGDFDDEFQALRPSPPPERRRTEESALSPSTRAMLEKLKQSTQELEGLTEEQDDLVTFSKKGGARGQAARKSRFLKNVNTNDDPGARRAQERMEDEDKKYANSLANEVLGLRTDSMGDDYDKFRPEQTYRPEPPARKKYDFDASPPPTASKYVDDDDTDAMINNLKKMTTRKAATDIVSAAEKEFEPVKFEPIASFKDTFRTSPEPERRFGSLQRPKGKTRKQPSPDELENPFSSIRKSLGG